jgi:iron(III) transport system substrate-binding protein
MEKTTIVGAISLISILIAGAAIVYSNTLFTSMETEIGKLQDQVDMANEVLELAGYKYLFEELEDKYEVITGARDERKLVFYTTQGATSVAGLMEGFRKKYPFIEAEFFRGSAYTVLEKYMAEVRAGNVFCDVFSITDLGGFLELKDNDYLLEYESPEHAFYLEGYVDPGWWCSYRALINVWTVNTDFINPETIKTSDDILNQTFKGKIAIEDATVSGTALMTYYVLKEAYGIEFWQGLAELEPTIFTGTGPIIEKIAAGEKWIGPVGTYRMLDYRDTLGAPVEMCTLEEGNLVFPTPLGIVSQAPHPNAAKLFIDYVLSLEGQTLLIEDWLTDSVREDAPTVEGLPTGFAQQAFQVDWSEISSTRRDELMEEFKEIFGL